VAIGVILGFIAFISLVAGLVLLGFTTLLITLIVAVVLKLLKPVKL
jgi:hypothetical protein